MTIYFFLFFIATASGWLRNFFSITNKYHNFFKHNKEIPFAYSAIPFIKNKKLIVLTPGGLFGFYTLGVSSFIKDRYNLDDLIFSGTSAGAWNSLFLSYKGDDKNLFINKLIDNVQNSTSLNKMIYNMKQYLLDNFDDDDFDLSKIYIGVAVMEKPFVFKLHIYNDFTSLDDLIECCIASSHIPFITGGFSYKYRGLRCFDGGFYSYPYVSDIVPAFVITPSMWNSSATIASFPISTLINYKSKPLNLTDLYFAGYNDTIKHRFILDQVFSLK